VVKRFYNYYIAKEKGLARKFKDVLGFVPKNISLFKLAFFHKSMNSGNGTKTDFSNNERLEYLGDAILSTIVAEYLFKKYPSQNEGFLTKMRSKIVKRKTLNQVAASMGLDMILSEYSQGILSQSMLGNALEALVGAIYIECGYPRTRDYVIENILMQHLDVHELETVDDNYKSLLLEWAQKHGKEVEYKLIAKSKLNKRDRFKVGVVINGKQEAAAEDFNKKSAEQTASSLVLTKLNIQEE